MEPQDPISTVDPLSPEIPAVDESHLNDSSPPSDQLGPASLEDIRAKIIKQVEYYFSDENLPNDKFMMKHVNKDKEGFVSISLIASFRKVKRLTKDGSLIVDALKESSQLVVSSDGKKVKRLHPLPLKEIRDTKSCTVVVENLPEDHSTENIKSICGQVGSIKSISIHNPHAAEDARRSSKGEKPISCKLHALIEYETVQDAEKAVATLNDETDWRNGLRVQLLQKRMGYGLGKKAWRGSETEKGGHARGPFSVKDEDSNNSKEQHDVAPAVEDRDHESKDKLVPKGRNRSKGRKYHGNNGMGHGTASVVEASKPPPGPRMPDGTRGFTMGRGQPLVSSNV